MGSRGRAELEDNYGFEFENEKNSPRKIFPQSKKKKRYYLHRGRQGKHMLGHSNYILGRSPVTISFIEIERLFNMYNRIPIDSYVQRDGRFS